MARNVNITSKGISKVLKNYSAGQAVAEYIWNGFDAKATIIHVDYDYNELGTIERIRVTDNTCAANTNDEKLTYYCSFRLFLLSVF